MDGTGAPWVRADVGITGNHIEAIGALRREDARAVIDATDMVVAPGFIDMLGQSEFALLVDSRAASSRRRSSSLPTVSMSSSPNGTTRTLSRSGSTSQRNRSDSKREVVVDTGTLHQGVMEEVPTLRPRATTAHRFFRVPARPSNRAQPV